MIIDYAGRARALVGTRFRLQGRTELGLDCVGLAAATYAIPADKIRRDYRIRGDHAGEVRQTLRAYFRRVAARESRAGDLMLLRVAQDQLHLAIRTDEGFVHAHAGLRRVVETPSMPEWPLLGVYRRRTR